MEWDNQVTGTCEEIGFLLSPGFSVAKEAFPSLVSRKEIDPVMGTALLNPVTVEVSV